MVIADEVYEHLIFDGRQHVPIATLPGMRERTITIGSAGKTFSVTGWKIGWACASPALLGAVRTVKQFLTYVNGAPFQVAVAAALPYAEKLSPAAALQEQRDLFCDGLRALGCDVIVPQATYFATVDVGQDGVEYCRDAAGAGRRGRHPEQRLLRLATRVTGSCASRSASVPRCCARALERLAGGGAMRVAAIQHDITWEHAGGHPATTSGR